MYDIMCDDRPKWHPIDIKKALIALPIRITMFFGEKFASIILIFINCRLVSISIGEYKLALYGRLLNLIWSEYKQNVIKFV